MSRLPAARQVRSEPYRMDGWRARRRRRITCVHVQCVRDGQLAYVRDELWLPLFLMECQRSVGSVRIRLGASGADGGARATLDFYAWLRQTPDVRDHADVSLRPVEQDDSLRPAQQDDAETMGAVEIIELVLSQGFAALNLALAYASWRTARPSAPAVTLTGLLRGRVADVPPRERPWPPGPPPPGRPSSSGPLGSALGSCDSRA